MKAILSILFASALTLSAATTWTGSLTSTNGLFGTEQWSENVSLDWSVTQFDLLNWTYEYTFNVPSKDISHVIIEACGSDILYSSESQGKSNPLMPNPFHGVKFEGDSTSMTVTINSDKAPSWGNFYAKSGKNKGNDVALWNTGLENENGSYIPIAGCGGVNVIPEPSSIALLGLGLMPFIFKRKNNQNIKLEELK